MRFLFLLLTLGNFLLFAATVGQMKSEKRYAFIIANGVTSETGDDKVVISAKGLETFLKAKGFETVTAYNLDRAELIKTFRAFDRRVQPNAVIVLAYAGRSVTHDGQTWMLPAAMSLEGLEQLRLSAVSFNFLLTKMQSRAPRITVGLFDGFAYSAAKNSTDADRILSSMKGIKEIDLLVSWNARAKSSNFFPQLAKTVGGVEDDIAMIADNLERADIRQAIAEEDFYFNVPDKILTPEDKAWQRTVNKNSVLGYEAYLIAFPDSKYKQTAQERIAAINAKQAADLAAAKAQTQAAAQAGPTGAAEKTGEKEEVKVVFYEPAEMVTVPSGVYLMGSEQFENAKPVHTVNVEKPFKMSAYEVSNKEYAAFVKATGMKYRHKKLLENESAAAAYVSWEDAKAYAAWLSGVSGKEYRLPTEAEWEYAARAGSDTFFAWGDNTALAPQFAWMAVNAHGFVHSRGLLQPNAFGLFDMAGNVAEWCIDAVTPNYRGAPSFSNRAVVDENATKIIRGGSYKSEGEALSPSYREGNLPTYRSDTVGFRLVQSL